MNNLFISHCQKAGALVCLFLWCATAVAAPPEEWKFDAISQKAYDLVLNLQTVEAYAMLPNPKTPQEHYVLALGEALELLITEDGEKYTEYEDHFEERLERKIKLNSPDELLLLAEIRVQWAFVYLKYGHEFDAGLNLRQAFLTAKELKKRFPEYQAIKKTAGMLEVIIGSVPEQYNWVLSLLSMDGSIGEGMAELESFTKAGHPLSFEAGMISALAKGLLLQQTDSAVTEARQLLAGHPGNRLALFLGGALAIKNSQSEEALFLLNTLSTKHSGLPIYYAEYLKGEIYLHKAEYMEAMAAYRWFINHYKGQNFIKDAYYKVGLCYYLNGSNNDALQVFKQARTLGKEASEADKYAARSLADSELPHMQLTKARYATDGGYYDNARKILESITPAQVPSKRDQVELIYRKARLEHKTNHLSQAKELYKETVKQNGQEPWYYAPNACLQLGYLAWADNDLEGAKTFFTLALSYKKHEYKNSIDSKAKSALAQLKRNSGIGLVDQRR